MRKILFLALIVIFSGVSLKMQAQAVKPSVLTGDVTAVSSNKIVLQTKDGAVDVQISGTTEFKRVQPDNPSLKNALASNLQEISVGDKIATTGILSDDKKSLPARTVYLMTKGDISKRNEADQQAWRTRGISGRVVSLNPNTQEFTIAVRGPMGEQNMVVKPKNNINYRRYATNSVKFSDAKDSSFTELKVGDEVRALGNRTADNTNFEAERVVFGSFKMIGGTITAIDAAKNEITLLDIQTKKPVTIVVSSDTMLKKFPAEMATMMAMRQAGGGMQPPQGAGQVAVGGNVVVRPPQGQPGSTGAATTGQPQIVQGGPGMQQGGAGMRVAARGEFDDLLQRFPTISIADLKVGDAIGVSSSAAAEANRYMAIKLVSGVEPFFKTPQMTGGAPGGGANRGGSSLSIPGLDGGIGIP